ncbi:helix-turn-helix domain-containing protein [Streptomyces sp. NPDC001840]
MPRWKALPEELDPEVKEFASQLRRLVDRSGLSIAAVADRTGYSRTSWERYLNGRLLAPKGAIVALADVTGTNPMHLTTMWELAERAWSRAEMRHDMTMEAIRIVEAREALAATGETPVVGGPGTRGRPDGPGGAGAPAGPGGRGAPGRPAGPGGPGGPEGAGGPGRSGRPGGPAGPGGSWGARQQDGGAGGAGWGARPNGPARPGGSAGPYGGPRGDGATMDLGRGRGGVGVPTGPGPGPGSAPGPGPAPRRSRRKVVVFVGGIVGALLVIAGAVLLTDIGGDGDAAPAAKSPSPSPSTSRPVLPAGVKCAGDDCSGQDPEAMGCGGTLAKTVSSVTVGTALIEVRHSQTCGAAWARITQAAAGDEVRITPSEGKAEAAAVEAAAVNAYTPMVAVPAGVTTQACATLTTGETGCTEAQ